MKVQVEREFLEKVCGYAKDRLESLIEKSKDSFGAAAYWAESEIEEIDKVLEAE